MHGRKFRHEDVALPVEHLFRRVHEVTCNISVRQVQVEHYQQKFCMKHSIKISCSRRSHSV